MVGAPVFLCSVVATSSVCSVVVMVLENLIQNPDQLEFATSLPPGLIVIYLWLPRLISTLGLGAPTVHVHVRWINSFQGITIVAQRRNPPSNDIRFRLNSV